MLELELENVKATLEKWESKREKDGRRYALLHISCDLDANVLGFFADDLKDRMFKLDTDLAGGVLKLRDGGEVYPMSRSEEMTGALLTLAYGVGGPMVFADAVIDDFKIDPMEGGGVILRFRGKVWCDEGQAGRLHMLHGDPTKVTLEPMEPPMMKEAA